MNAHRDSCLVPSGICIVATARRPEAVTILASPIVHSYHPSVVVLNKGTFPVAPELWTGFVKWKKIGISRCRFSHGSGQ